MTADEWFDIINTKVERAKEHISDLETEIRSFLATNPYVIGTKRNPQTRQLIYYVVSVQDTPIRLSLITGDVLHNLRSALDHLACRLICVGGGTPTKQSAFPTTDTDSPQEYESNRTRKVKGMRQDAIDSIDALKPYKSGNDTLWRLHRLNNFDKHRLLITVGSAFQAVDIASVMLKAMRTAAPDHMDGITLQSLFIRPADPLCPLKAGDELFIDSPDAEENTEMKFAFNIALNEPGVIEGEPLIETLQGMTDAVYNIILGFKPMLV